MTARPVTGRGLLLVNAAVGLFGLAGVLGVLTGLPAPRIVLGRAVFGGLALIGFAVAQRLDVRVGRRDLPLILGQGVLLALHWTTFFQAIAVAGVAIGLLAFATFPLFTAALEPLLLRSRPSGLQLAGALASWSGSSSWYRSRLLTARPRSGCSGAWSVPAPSRCWWC